MEKRRVSGISDIRRAPDGRYIVIKESGSCLALTPEQWRDVSDEIWRREFEAENPTYDRV